MFAFVGNGTDDASVSGIYTYVVEESGALDLQHFVAQPRPHWITVSPTGTRLYAGSFVAFTDGSPGGAVYSYDLDPGTGRLTEINHRILPFTFASYVQPDRTEHFLLVACTSGGGVAVLPIDAAGAIGEPTSVHAHRGTPMVPLGATERPKVMPPDTCQPHAIAADPTNRLVIVPDLAPDRVVLYRFDAELGHLEPIEPEVSLPPGTGPRLFVFHPTNGLLYMLNEMASSITVFSYDADAGSVQPLHTVPALPADFTEPNMSLGLAFAEHGKFLYCTNKGHDSISMFAVVDSAPYLEPLGWQSANGEWPAGIAAMPEGPFLYVASRISDRVVSFVVDGTTGALEPTGHVTDVPAPNSVALL